MSSNFKSAAISHGETLRGGNFYRLAVVGAGTLKGKEVADVLNDRNFPSIDVKLLDDDESFGKLEAVGEEVTFIQSVRHEQFENMDFTFFASDSESTRRNWKTARNAGSAIVDLSFALEDEPAAAIRSPWIERQLGQLWVPELQPGPAVVAHPAAVVLALLVLRVQKAGPVKRAVATVFEPASEHGQKGMDELHEQTVNLLSFQQLPKGVFDAQVAFNVVDRYGERSTPPLSAVEDRIQRHFRSIVQGKLNVPSLMLLQAPIFHGHAFSLYIELDTAAQNEELVAAVSGEHVDVLQGAEESPSNVNAAGQEQIQVFVRRDAQNANGFWLWAATDNLRIAALSAVECAESMIASRPRGTVQ